MNKLLLIMLFLTVFTQCAFSQKQVFKEAKTAVKAGDLAKAESLINNALINQDTKNDAEVWNLAGIIENKKSAKQMESAYLKKPYDTLTIYNCALKMCKYFIKCDSLSQIPDNNGKIKNKFRKANIVMMLSERNNLANGGIYYYNKAAKNGGENQEDYLKALEFWKIYVDMPSYSMFEQEEVQDKDSLLTQIAYYTSLAAMKIKDYSTVIKYAKIAENDRNNGLYALQFEAQAYKELKDYVNMLRTLKTGIEKYPDDNVFFANLIDYYSADGKYDDALVFADDMISRKPDNFFYYYVKGYLFSGMKDYDQALDCYRQTIEKNPNYAQAYSNIGLCYRLKAQQFSMNATTDINDPKYVESQRTLKDLFQKARPYYEKARELEPQNKDLWLDGLYSVYYNLHLGREFDEIERIKNEQ